MNYEKYRKRHPVKMTLSMFLIYTVLELSVPAGILFALVCGNLRFFILQTLRISFIFANIASLIIIRKKWKRIRNIYNESSVSRISGRLSTGLV